MRENNETQVEGSLLSDAASSTAAALPTSSALFGFVQNRKGPSASARRNPTPNPNQSIKWTERSRDQSSPRAAPLEISEGFADVRKRKSRGNPCLGGARLPSVPPPDTDNLLKIGLDRDHFRRLGISEMQE